MNNRATDAVPRPRDAPNLMKNSPAEVQRERSIFTEGEHRDRKEIYDLSTSHANIALNEPPSPRPLLAPSPEPDDIERAASSPPIRSTKEESLEEGLWMRKYRKRQRPQNQCSFESKGGINDLFDYK